jgi:S-adenosylmethionine:diacylglycerol 3-amino-3-carboxypropyl transferase
MGLVSSIKSVGHYSTRLHGVKEEEIAEAMSVHKQTSQTITFSLARG